ncbi:MAG: alpha/beta hydrolase [Pseudomonadota bacterium]
MTEKRFETQDGLTLGYTDAGAGFPVLCLAGLTRDARDFDAIAAHLAPRYRVLRLDSRGRGRSDWAPNPVESYQVPVEAADAAALLDHLGLSQVAVLGTSRGGFLGMVLAATRPGLLTGLILNDVGAVVEGAGMKRIANYLGRAYTAPDFDTLARQLQSAYAADFPGTDLGIWQTAARAMAHDDGGKPVLSYDPALRDAFLKDFDAENPTLDLWPLFEAVGSVPVLCLRGANSDILSAPVAAEMAARNPAVTLTEVPDRGHVPFLDEPAATAAIDAFLARTTP